MRVTSQLHSLLMKNEASLKQWHYLASPIQILQLSHCNKRSPRSNEDNITIDAIGKQWSFKIWLLWRVERALLLDWVPAWFFDGRFWRFGCFRSVRRFGSAVMTSSVPRVGCGGGGCAEVRLVLRLENESISTWLKRDRSCHQRDLV